MTAAPSPGWYPDPADPSGLRWYDGTAWTQNVRRAAAAPSAPQPMFTAPSIGHQASVVTPQQAASPWTGQPQQAAPWTAQQQATPWAQQQSWAPAPTGRSAGMKALIVIASLVGGFFVLGILAAIAIPVFLNQRTNERLAELDALTCEQVAAAAVDLSQQEVTGSDIPLASIADPVLVADDRAMLQRPGTGRTSHVLTCGGSGTWQDGVVTPVTVDVYIDSTVNQVLDVGWVE